MIRVWDILDDEKINSCALTPMATLSARTSGAHAIDLAVFNWTLNSASSDHYTLYDNLTYTKKDTIEVMIQELRSYPLSTVLS
jgi:pyruvate/oxaloacetate carboxyltransferase